MSQKKNTLLLNRDALFSVICLAVIAAASLLLYKDVTSQLSFSTTEKVGTIVFKRNRAQRKYASYSVWEKLKQKAPVYNKDRIRTFKESDARLIMDGGINVGLSEESLIFVNTTPRGLEIEFNGGNLNTTATSRITIKYKDTSIIVDAGTDFSLKEEGDDQARLTVNNGRATIENGNDSLVIEKDKTALIEEKDVTVTDVIFKNRYPYDGSIIVIGNNKEKIDFSWEDGTKELNLTISEHADFSSPLFAGTTTKTALSLDEGIYYWKLGDGAQESDIFTLTINSEPTPQLLTPTDNSTIDKFDDSSSFEASWLNRGSADSYTFSVYDDTNKPVQHITTYNNSATIKGLSDGTYTLAVTANYSYALNAYGNVSKTFTINVKNTEHLSKPIVVSPANGQVLSAKLFPDPGMTIAWKGDQAADEYIVSLYKDGQEGTPLNEFRTTRSYITIDEILSPGNYSARIEPHRNDLKGDSTVTSFTIGTPPGPQITHPEENTSTGKGKDVAFSWKDDSNSFSYKLEIAKDQGFNSILLNKQTKKLSVNQKLNEPGIYYGRVSIVNKKGEALVSSKVRKFSIAGEIKAPTFENVPKEINVSTATALNCSWKPVKTASEYSLTLYRSNTGLNSTAVYTTKTEGTALSIPNIKSLDQGIYYFSIQAMEYQDGMLLNTSSPTTHYFKVLKNQALEILTSGEIFIILD